MSILNAAMLLEFAAQQKPEKTFLLDGGRRHTFGQVEREARRMANVLAALGIVPGEKVALLIPNESDFPVCLFGCFKYGAVPVILNVTAPGPEIASYLAASQAVALIAAASLAVPAGQGFAAAGSCRHLIVADHADHPDPALPPPAQRLSRLMAAAADEFRSKVTKADEPAAILYTSGTTGQPKGIVKSHFNYHYFGQFSAHDFWQLGPDDVILMVAPGSSIFAQSMLASACVAQAAVSLLPRFFPEAFLKAIQDHRVTFFAGVPTLVHFMLNSPLVNEYDLTSLRRVMISGAPLPYHLAQEFSSRFQVAMVTGYGMTEAVPITFMNADMYPHAPSGAVGRPALGVSIRIVDENGRDLPVGEQGQILFRGPQLCKGYDNSPEEWDRAWQNGWFHTGDIGRLDEKGYLFIVERLKDMIKRSGHAVYPSEVEQALYKHPAVAEAAVIGEPHDVLGEEVKAVVVLKPGATATAGELIEHCRSLVAAFKYPRLIEFRDSLPKNHSGKILRWALREVPN